MFRYPARARRAPRSTLAAMRFTLPVVLLLSLACSGGPAPEKTTNTAENQPEAPKPTVPPAPPAPPAPDPAAALSDHWLVILASKKDAAEATPALDALAAHPDVSAHPGTLSSSRFKNLMPCYTVAYAEATTDKKVALDLSKKLKELGVDWSAPPQTPTSGAPRARGRQRARNASSKQPGRKVSEAISSIIANILQYLARYYSPSIN